MKISRVPFFKQSKFQSEKLDHVPLTLRGKLIHIINIFISL